MPNSVEALGFSRTARFVYVYANVRILIPACHEIEWYVKEDVDLVQQHLNHPATSGSIHWKNSSDFWGSRLHVKRESFATHCAHVCHIAGQLMKQLLMLNSCLNAHAERQAPNCRGI